jgi:hypothetical protein
MQDLTEFACWQMREGKTCQCLSKRVMNELRMKNYELREANDNE